MTAPALDALRDIHLPPAPLLATALPQWWLAAATLALLAGAGWYLGRFTRRRGLRAALRQLRGLAAAHARDGDATRLASGLSGVLRRYAMLRFPQAGIASLTGIEWLGFLDAHGGGGAFCGGPGAVIDTRPYQPSGAFDGEALIALVRSWLRANPP
jgi:hypothetical protein